MLRDFACGVVSRYVQTVCGITIVIIAVHCPNRPTPTSVEACDLTKSSVCRLPNAFYSAPLANSKQLFFGDSVRSSARKFTKNNPQLATEYLFRLLAELVENKISRKKRINIVEAVDRLLISSLV